MEVISSPQPLSLSPSLPLSLSCRSGYFDFVSEVIEHGIKLYKFVLPDIELDNTTQEAGGFHAQIPSGVLNLTAVMPSNVPLFASKPHFLHADPVYRENVSGMHPVVSIHDSYLALEPITGTCLTHGLTIGTHGSCMLLKGVQSNFNNEQWKGGRGLGLVYLGTVLFPFFLEGQSNIDTPF